MVDTFKAAILTELNQPLKIVELIHQNPDEHQVKIKMVTTGLCGAQVNEMTGKKGPDKYLPHLMGHEGYGEVVQVGSGVSKVKIGDHVVIHWRQGSGLGTPGVSYRSKAGLTIGAGPCTTFGEYTIVAENRCSKVPKSDELKYVLPLLGCAVSTAYGAVTKEARVAEDDSIIIFGAGGLGMAIIFWCKVLGFSNVDVVDIHEGKRRQVEDFGGKLVLLDELDDTAKYKKIFETSGVVSNIEKSLAVATKDSTIILIGQPRVGESVTFTNFLKYYDNIKMVPSMGGSFDPDLDITHIYNACVDNAELAKNLISKRISLDEINEGFMEMKAPTSRRIIIDFSGDTDESK